MVLPAYTTQNTPFAFNNFAGGLNSASGPLGLNDTESSDLQNVDFNKFGSVVKRSGYTALNTIVPSLSTGSITAFADLVTGSTTTVTSATHNLSNGDVVQITGTTSYDGTYTISGAVTNTFVIDIAFVADDATGTWNETSSTDGLHWFEYVTAGNLTRYLTKVNGSKLWKMDGLDGTWDDITGSLTLTTGNHCDFETFRNTMFATNDQDLPFKWTGSGNASVTTVPTDLTKAKFMKLFNNYMFLANVLVDGTRHNSRIYWSNLGFPETWTVTDFIDIARDDGQEITGLKVLSDRLVVFKSRSIYNVFYTGDTDVPFYVQKSNSQVGCAGGFTIQEVNNGHVFLSYDGLYFYDGNNSFKISDKINPTITSLNDTKFDKAVSVNLKNKNRYMVAVSSSGQSQNNRLIVWDYFNNSFSIYVGINACSMTAVYVSGTEERPYFSDYKGFTYRADVGTSDNPLNVATAISAYYYTNWKSFGDLVSKKGVPQVYIYHQNSNTTLTFTYAFDFDSNDTYTNTFTLATSSDVYGTGVYGTAVYAGAGGDIQRRDLTGRGGVVRLKFENNALNEGFQIDGLGVNAYLESNV